MRPILIVMLFLAGCASDEYSRLPEPSGPWVPANPPGLTALPLPTRL